MVTITLIDSEISTLTNICRVAADKFKANAESFEQDFRLSGAAHWRRLGEQFRRQEQEAREFALRLEDAD